MVSWKAPDIMEELSELRRTAKEIGISLQALFNSVETGSLKVLGEIEWKKLDNTDSFSAKSEREAKKRAKKYGKDFEIIQDAFLNGGSLPAPIVLHLSGRAPYLVSGNTRLMAARINKQDPQVWVADLRSLSKNSLAW